MIGVRAFGSTWWRRRRSGRLPRAGAGHELPLADGQHVGAHDPRELHPPGGTHHEDDVEQARPQREDHAHGEQDVGDGQEHVHDPHDEGVGPAAEEAGEEAERHTDERGQRHRGEADPERDAATVEDAAQDVAAEMIGAERMLAQPARLPHRRPQPLEQHLLARVPGRQLRRQHRRTAHHQQHAQAERGAEAHAPPPARGERQRGRGGDDAHRALRT